VNYNEHSSRVNTQTDARMHTYTHSHALTRDGISNAKYSIKQNEIKKMWVKKLDFNKQFWLQIISIYPPYTVVAEQTDKTDRHTDRDRQRERERESTGFTAS
jgi:hypothetical protein